MTKHSIEVLDYSKGKYLENVIYLADGVEIVVSGEFYIDAAGNRHHTHIFNDGMEMDVVF